MIGKIDDKDYCDVKWFLYRCEKDWPMSKIGRFYSVMESDKFYQWWDE